MNFYVKDATGALVLATQDQILDINSVLYNEAGEQLNRTKTAVKVDKDPIADLAQTVKDLALSMGTVAHIKEKQEQIEAKLAAYSEVERRGGIALPKGLDSGLSKSDVDSIYAEYDMAKQGKRLTDTFAHPKTAISEDRRVALAKYMTLMIKSSVFKDPAAIRKFHEVYGKTGTTVVGDAGNAWVIPDIVDSEILHFARETSTVLQYARIWDMISDKQSFPREATGVAVTWGNTTAESDPTATEFELDAYELSAYSAVREDTLADSRSDIVSWLTELMGNACGLELDNVAFNGDGTSTYAGCSGILSAACGYSVVMGSGSTAFSNLTYTNLSDMIGKLDGLKKQGAMFMMNGAVMHYIRTLKDDQSRPVFIETVGAPMSGTIFGYPYKEVVKMPSTSGANTAFMAFGNLQYFALGRRLGASALKVDPYGLFTTNRIRFKIYQRWGLGMGLPEGFVRLLTHS